MLLTPKCSLLGIAFLFCLLFFFSLQGFAYASPESNDVFSLTVLFSGLFGGMALFLYGMEKMSAGMKKSTGNQMRSILATLTKNRFIALLVGAIVTMVIQSSSATTIMLISFVQAELMTFVQALGIILGANIGTTITAQMVAFKLTDYALVMLTAGFVLRMFAGNERVKSMGEILLGFGILFYGIKLMGDAMAPLRTYPDFLAVMANMENPMLGILAGAVFTALVQSSSASTGIVIVLAQQGLLTIEAGIPIILGANIGTCVTAGLATIGTTREAKRVALAHVLFNIGGVLIFAFWIPQFAWLISQASSSFDVSTARQIANAHTIFNLSVGLIFLPFITLAGRLIFHLLPDSPVEKGVKPIAWHLDEAMISTPVLALQLARAEIARMAKLLSRMHRAVILPFITSKPQRDAVYPQLSLVEGIAMREKKINFLEERIREYLLKISRQELAEGQGREVSGLISLLDTMERMGDVITKLAVPLIAKKQQLRVDFSSEGKDELINYHRKVGKQLERLQEVLTTMDVAIAQKIQTKEQGYEQYDDLLRKHHLQRLLSLQEGTLQTHSIHVELMDAMHQISIYSTTIAGLLMSSGMLKSQEKEDIQATEETTSETTDDSSKQD